MSGARRRLDFPMPSSEGLGLIDPSTSPPRCLIGGGLHTPTPRTHLNARILCVTFRLTGCHLRALTGNRTPPIDDIMQTQTLLLLLLLAVLGT